MPGRAMVEMSVETLVAPLLGLEDDFPSTLYLLHHTATGKYGCYCHNGVHGLACFSTDAGAVRFGEWINTTSMVTVEVDFDGAREVAKSRPLPIVSLMLLDSMDDPKIHYVR